MRNNICIIPARGGSKRIPRKNIKEFLGKPIISYSIEAAIKSNLFDEIIVSTDDLEISNIAIQYGANVPFLRSLENSNDFATTLDVLTEVVTKLELSQKNIINICCIYPTAPFVTQKRLIEAFDIFELNRFDSLFPVIKYSFPTQRSLIKEENKISFQFPEFRNSRSQDLTETFHDAGQFYWLKKSVLSTDSLVTLNSGCILIDELEGQDIDNEIDWKIAEIKYELLQNIK